MDTKSIYPVRIVVNGEPVAVFRDEGDHGRAIVTCKHQFHVPVPIDGGVMVEVCAACVTSDLGVPRWSATPTGGLPPERRRTIWRRIWRGML